MTLKKYFLISMAAVSLFATSAEAYLIPGDRPDPYPAPGYPSPPPPPPGSGYPGYPPGGGYDRTEQKSFWLGRRVVDERIDLLRMAGIDSRYNGYQVESVVIQIRTSGTRSEVALLANGRLEDSVYSPAGSVLLSPRYANEIGRDIRSLELEVRQNMQIDSVTINLRQRYQPPVRELEVPIYVNRRLYGNDRVDVLSYLNVPAYRGYRIVSMAITGRAVYGNSMMDVLFNSFKVGPSLYFGGYTQDQVVYPQNAVIGQSAASIVLYSSGDLELHKVVLRLSER